MALINIEKDNTTYSVNTQNVTEIVKFTNDPTTYQVFVDGYDNAFIITEDKYQEFLNADYSGGGGGGNVPTDLVEMVNDHQDKIYGYDTEVDAPSGDGDWFTVPTNVRADYDPNYYSVNDYVTFANNDLDKNKYVIQVNNKLLSLGKKKIAFVFDFKDYDPSVFSTKVSITTWIDGVSVPNDLEIGVSIINTYDNASLLYGNWNSGTLNKNQYAILQGTSNNMLLNCPNGIVDGGAIWSGTDKVEVHVDGLLDRVTALENKPSGGIQSDSITNMDFDGGRTLTINGTPFEGGSNVSYDEGLAQLTIDDTTYRLADPSDITNLQSDISTLQNDVQEKSKVSYNESDSSLYIDDIQYQLAQPLEYDGGNELVINGYTINVGTITIE